MTERLCSEDGCEGLHLARGYCKTHYVRWQRSRPEYLEKQREYDRKRRQTEHRRSSDRERLRRRRRRNGIQPRPLISKREQKRRQARRARAERKLEMALRPGRARHWIAGPCPGCGELFVGHSEVCSKTCRKRLDRWADREAYGNHRERARRHGVRYEPVDVTAVMERDGHRCQLCRRKTKGRWPAPTSSTLDHIVPMSVGGAHTYGNVQCACLACNSRKGAASRNDQLRLNIREERRGEGTVATVA